MAQLFSIQLLAKQLAAHSLTAALLASLMQRTR